MSMLFSSPSSSPPLSRSSTPSAFGEPSRFICTPNEIRTQLLDENESVRFQCLAYAKRTSSSKYHRCQAISKKFRNKHKTLFNRATRILVQKASNRPVDDFCTVVRILFCETHHVSTQSDEYSEWIQPHWKGDGSDEEEQLFDIIRQVFGFSISVQSTPVSDKIRAPPTQEGFNLVREATANADGTSAQPVIQCTPPPIGTVKFDEQAQSLSGAGLSSVSSMELRNRRLFPPPVQSRHTRSRSNPPQLSSEPFYAQVSEKEPSTDLGQNKTPFPSSSYSVSKPILLGQIPGPRPSTASPVIPAPGFSTELPIRKFLTTTAPTRHTRRKSNPLPPSSNVSDPSLRSDTRLGLHPTATSNFWPPSSSNYFSPPRSPFDFTFGSPQSQVSDSSSRTATPLSLRSLSNVPIFTTTQVQRPVLHEQSKALTEPTIMRTNDFVTAVSLPIPHGRGFNASRQVVPAMRFDAQPPLSSSPASSSSVEWAHVVDWDKCLAAMDAGKNLLRLNERPPRQMSKDDTFLEQTADSVAAAAPPLFNARTKQTTSASGKTISIIPTIIDSLDP